MFPLHFGNQKLELPAKFGFCLYSLQFTGKISFHLQHEITMVNTVLFHNSSKRTHEPIKASELIQLSLKIPHWEKCLLKLYFLIKAKTTSNHDYSNFTGNQPNSEFLELSCLINQPIYPYDKWQKGKTG